MQTFANRPYKIVLGLEKLRMTLKIAETRIKSNSMKQIEKVAIQYSYQKKAKQFEAIVSLLAQ